MSSIEIIEKSSNLIHEGSLYTDLLDCSSYIDRWIDNQSDSGKRAAVNDILLNAIQNYRSPQELNYLIEQTLGLKTIDYLIKNQLIHYINLLIQSFLLSYKELLD